MKSSTPSPLLALCTYLPHLTCLYVSSSQRERETGQFFLLFFSCRGFSARGKNRGSSKQRAIYPQSLAGSRGRARILCVFSKTFSARQFPFFFFFFVCTYVDFPGQRVRFLSSTFDNHPPFAFPPSTPRGEQEKEEKYCPTYLFFLHIQPASQGIRPRQIGSPPTPPSFPYARKNISPLLLFFSHPGIVVRPTLPYFPTS